MEYFFFLRKLCFLWSLCLLFIAESISLDTSGKTTVGFFLKITSPSWIILSISLDELNSIDWWRVDYEFSWHFMLLLWKNFEMAKNIRGFLEALFEYFFWILLWVLTSSVIWNYCEYCPGILLQVRLKQETKIDGRGHEIFSEKITRPWKI